MSAAARTNTSAHMHEFFGNNALLTLHVIVVTEGPTIVGYFHVESVG